MVKNIPVGSKVICSDGKEGKSTAVVVDPATKEITYVAVVEKSIVHGEDRLVPIDKVVKTSRDTIELNCTLAEVLETPPPVNNDRLPALPKPLARSVPRPVWAKNLLRGSPFASTPRKAW